MATSGIYINSLEYSTKKQRELIRMLRYDRKVRLHINGIIAKEVQDYVPMKKGGLRRSIRITERGITWGSGIPYAHYQFAGKIYDVNKAKIRGKGENARIVGWYSPKGVQKTNSGRELGAPRESLLGWKFGYTTPGTTHHWTRVYTGKSQTGFNPVKMKVNAEITRYLKDECKARGLNV